MQTPAGEYCKFYYEDFHRGRDIQECRAPKTPQSGPWMPKDCAKCPIPKILRANSSPNMEIQITIRRPILGLGHKVLVTATCTQHNIKIANPYTGCPQCNAERPGLALFEQALDDIDD